MPQKHWGILGVNVACEAAGKQWEIVNYDKCGLGCDNHALRSLSPAVQPWALKHEGQVTERRHKDLFTTVLRPHSTQQHCGQNTCGETFTVGLAVRMMVSTRQYPAHDISSSLLTSTSDENMHITITTLQSCEIHLAKRLDEYSGFRTVVQWWMQKMLVSKLFLCHSYMWEDRDGFSWPLMNPEVQDTHGQKLRILNCVNSMTTTAESGGTLHATYVETPSFPTTRE